MADLLKNIQTQKCMAAAAFALSLCLAASVGHTNDSRVQQMTQEREEFVKEIRRVENLNRKYTDEIEQLRTQIKKQQDDFESRMASLERKVKEGNRRPERKVKMQQVSSGVSPELEEATFDILSQGAEMDLENEAFREELARAHYNMGNIFYERGEYQRAVVEYYQSLDLVPYDSDTHYNLAHVSGDYLGDQETALKHYQWYLYLNPTAEDKNVVTAKMVDAKMHLRSVIDSPLEERGNSNYNIAR